MRPKAGYPMIGRRSASTSRAAPTGPSAHPAQQRGASSEPEPERTTRGRTSTPGSQAIARSPIRRACNGKPRHPPYRSPHGPTPRGRPRGEANTELHAEWSFDTGLCQSGSVRKAGRIATKPLSTKAEQDQRPVMPSIRGLGRIEGARELLLLTGRDHRSGSLRTPIYVWGDPGKARSRGLSAQLAAVAALGLHGMPYRLGAISASPHGSGTSGLGTLPARELRKNAHLSAEIG